MTEACPTPNGPTAPSSRDLTEYAAQLSESLRDQAQRDAFVATAGLVERILLVGAHDKLVETRRLFYPYSPDNPEVAEALRQAVENGKSKQAKKAAKNRSKHRKNLSAGWSSVVPSMDGRLISLRESVRSMADEGGFSSISTEDIETAMIENQAFEVELEVDWDRYEDLPVIYARRRHFEKIEGRFLREKLPGYMLRGSLGVFVIGTLLLGVHLLLDLVVLPDAMISQVVSSATVEHMQTLGPGHRDEFGLDHRLKDGQRIEWEVKVEDADGVLKPIGSLPDGRLGMLVPATKPNHVGYQAPTEVPRDGFDVVFTWTLFDANGREINKRNSRYEVKRRATLPPLRRPLRGLSMMLLILGVAGMFAGLVNLLRPPVIRMLKKNSNHSSNPPKKVKRKPSFPRAESFRDLFRKETIEREILGEVVVAVKTKDSPCYQLALYRDIPLADLETVLPSTRPRVKFMDGFVFVMQIGYGALLFLFRLVIILAATVVSFGLGAIIALFNAGGFATRSWSRFRTTVKHLATAVDQVLYRRTVGSSLAVLNALADRMHERQCLVAIQMWHTLLMAQNGVSEVELLQAARNAKAVKLTAADVGRLISIGLADRHGERIVGREPVAALGAVRERWVRLAEK